MFRRFAFFLAAATAVLVVACDNNPNPAPLHKTRPDGSPWVVFNWALTSDPDTFDPQHCYDQQSRRVIEAVYDTLLDYHPFKTDPYEVMPNMLAEMPVKEEGSNGELSYLCRLKEGILFHNDPCFPAGKGREVVAEDVHFAFQRICDPKVASPFFGPIADAVIGMREAHAAAVQNGSRLDYDRHRVSGVEVLDKYRFRIRLSRPYPQLMYWMAFQCLSPVAREATEFYNGGPNGDFTKFTAVGTGPYRIAKYVPRQRVQLVRAENYKTAAFPSEGFPPEKEDFLRSLAGKPLPFIDEVNLSIISEPLPMFVLTRQGYLDRMAANQHAFSSLLTPERSLAPRYKERGMFLEKDAEPSTFWISFNMDDPVVGTNKKLRQALSCAYDAATQSEIFYSGVAPVATQLLPPGFFGHEEDRKNPYGYDFERAKRLLAEAGFPNGIDAQGRKLELTMQAVTSSGDHRARAQFDQQCFERLGITIRVGENDFPTLLSKKDSGQFQISTGSGWGADYPDAENFFFLFYSKNIPPAGKNETRYRNAEFDQLFEKMAVMENTPERLALIQRMNDILAEDVPLILTFNKHMYTVIQPWARRTHQNHMLEGGVKFLTIDAAMRARVRKDWNHKPVWPFFLLGGFVIWAGIYAVRWNRRHNA